MFPSKFIGHFVKIDEDFFVLLFHYVLGNTVVIQIFKKLAEKLRRSISVVGNYLQNALRYQRTIGITFTNNV